MKILLPLALIVAFLLLYALRGRDWLKSKEWANPFFEWVEPIEIRLFKKSPTILFARLLTGLGGVLTALQQLDGIDFTPIMPLIPEEHRGKVQAVVSMLPLSLSLIGGAIEWLRNRTTLPIELVSVPDKLVAANPVIAEAVATADQAKVAAVETVKAA